MNRSYTQYEATTVDKEHSIQIQLINLLSKAVSDEAADEEKLSILNQLLNFSQMHFMSEQLIMRQHDYDGYDEHNNEHMALVDYLQELKQTVNEEKSGLKLQQLDDLQNRLLNHIDTQDQKLSMFLSEQ